MRVGIIAGTDIYDIPGIQLEAKTVETSYGPALLHVGQGEAENLVFLMRHGPRHTVPPHHINYRANLKAMHKLGVRAIVAAYAVGSIHRALPPLSVAVLDDFLDFTSDRPRSFYEGGASGLAHTIMSPPYCPTLRERLLACAPSCGLTPAPHATYVCTNGPRFETPGEIRMFRQLGGDVVGMTGAQEATLARELGIHFAGVAFSVNWAAGIEETINIVQDGIADLRSRLLSLFLKTLSELDGFSCHCEDAVLFTHYPRDEDGHDRN
ncbi:MAG: S-methyl-5'-thioadenosine phosphorylase [Caldilineae bacterium]|nr:MAG: S-methyl-5'-thioadenosine phosphorylase [Caldilineae bacterium]